MLNRPGRDEYRDGPLPFWGLMAVVSCRPFLSRDTADEWVKNEAIGFHFCYLIVFFFHLLSLFVIHSFSSFFHFYKKVGCLIRDLVCRFLYR